MSPRWRRICRGRRAADTEPRSTCSRIRHRCQHLQRDSLLTASAAGNVMKTGLEHLGTRRKLRLFRRAFGSRGWWLALRTKFATAPFEATAQPEGIAHPVTMRLKTSDLA